MESKKEYGKGIELEREVESFGRKLAIKQGNTIIKLRQLLLDFSGELGGTVWDASLGIFYFQNNANSVYQIFRKYKALSSWILQRKTST